MPPKRKFSTIASNSVEGNLSKKPRNRKTRTTAEATLSPSPSNIGTDINEVERLKTELEATKKRLEQAEEDSKRKSALLSHIHRLVECGICKEYLCNPYMLQCGHSTCLQCLCAWWTTSGKDRKCPECTVVSQHQPVLNYRLRSIMDVLKTAEQPQGDGDCGREDGMRENFPSVSGSSMNTQSYIPPAVQGQIQTPFPTSPSSRDRSGAESRRAERRSSYSPHPYNNPALLQRRNDRYDPVHEAAREMQQRREYQRRSRPPSPPILPILPITHITEEELDFGPSSQVLEHARVVGVLTIERDHPRRLSQPTIHRQLVLAPRSRPNSQLRLPPISELLSITIPSDVTLPPILNVDPDSDL